MKKNLFSVMSILLGVVVGVIGTRKQMRKKIIIEKTMSNKHLTLFLMMNQWVKVKQDGKNLSEYFEKNDYHELAIYGMSFVGKTLIDELEGSNIKVKYGIDKNADRIYAEINVLTPNDKLENVDVIVVTAIQFFDEIELLLSRKVKCPIISLEDILYEI